MRKGFVTIDAGDRRAMAGGVAAAAGLVALLALRADWDLLDGILAFHRTGRNVAAYVLGLDLLPWALIFTAFVAVIAVTALGYACGATASGTARERPRSGARARNAGLAKG